jgi:hypothetical protein
MTFVIGLCGTRIIDDFSVAFFVHPFVNPVARTMVSATLTCIFNLTWCVNIASAIVSCFVPMIGDLFFADVPYEGNISSSLNPAAPEVIIGKIPLWIIAVCSTVMYAVFVGQTVVQAITAKSWDSYPVSNVLSRVAACLFSGWMNLLGDIWNLIFSQLGSSAFDLLAFVLPPIYYLT